MSPRIYRSLACLPLGAVALAASAQPAQALSQPTAHALAFTFHHENVLGTSMQLGLSASSHDIALRAESAVLATIDRYALILSAWNPHSEFSHWLATRDEAVRVSPQLLEVLALFDHWRAQTHGAIDASAQAAIRLWQTALAARRQPSPADLASAVAAMQRPHWLLDHAAATAIRLSGTPLVLASFAKSYIAGHAADAALATGASGVLINIGGDIVVRGNLAQPIDIANPLAHAENDAPIDRVLLRNRAIATSGSYRRTLSPERSHIPVFSHIIDPRTARPTGHILSSTVIAPDPVTAGALATALSVLPVEESRALASRHPHADYLIVTSDGDRIASDNWASYRPASTSRGVFTLASYSPAQSTRPREATPAAAAFELAINLEIVRSDDFRYRRPYVAVWVEDEDRFPVRTIALWYGRDRWLPDLRNWYRDDQLRSRTLGTQIAGSISSATRPPGQYALKWDGKDDEGHPVKPAKYTLCIEAAREHGSYQVLRQEIDLTAGPRQFTLAPGSELGAITLDLRKQ